MFSLSKTDISQLRADVQGQIREKDSEDLFKQSQRTLQGSLLFVIQSNIRCS